MIENDNLKIIKSNIVRIISSYLKITRSGVNKYKANCPFHKEKTPSFHIDDYNHFYKCFGCGVGGDSLNFLQEFLKIDFQEAIKLGSQILGLKLEDNFKTKNINQIKKEDKYYALNKDLEDFLHKKLISSKITIKYLTDRSISEDSIRIFKLGYFNNCKEIIDFLKDKNHSLTDAIDLNIIRKNKNDDFFSMFEKRLIIPIKDKKGRTIAFGGRTTEKNDERAKYVNSANSDIFKKNENLFNIDKIYNSNNELFICEGYIDVIMLQQNNFRAIASLGTACNQEQIQEIFKISKEVYLCFDSDDAGQKASLSFIKKALEILKPEQNLKTIELYEAKDIDEFLKKNSKAAFTNLIKKAEEPNQYIFNNSIKRFNLSSPREKTLLTNELNEFVAIIKDADLARNYKEFFKDKMYQLKYSKYNNKNIQISKMRGSLYEQNLKRLKNIIESNQELILDQQIITSIFKSNIKELIECIEIKKDVLIKDPEEDLSKKELALYLINTLNKDETQNEENKNMKNKITRKNILDKKKKINDY